MSMRRTCTPPTSTLTAKSWTAAGSWLTWSEPGRCGDGCRGVSVGGWAAPGAAAPTRTSGTRDGKTEAAAEETTGVGRGRGTGRTGAGDVQISFARAHQPP